MSANVAIIGSGFGGLALAIRLQSAGVQTTIVEARVAVGGMGTRPWRLPAVGTALLLIGLALLGVPIFLADVDDIRWIALWDLIAIIYLTIRVVRLSRSKRAGDDKGAWVKNALGRRSGTLFTLFTSLVGITAGLTIVLIEEGTQAAALGKAMGVLAVLLAWAILHFGYADRYAQAYAAGMTLTEDPSTAAPAKEVGQARKRKEDARLITGKTQWTDNLTVPGMLHLAVLRSPVAHARVAGVRTEAALKSVGVHLIITGTELAHHFPKAGLQPSPLTPRRQRRHSARLLAGFPPMQKRHGLHSRMR